MADGTMKNSPVPIEDSNEVIKYINNYDDFTQDEASEDDNSLFSRLLSQRKPIDKQNYFNLIPDEITTMVFQYLDLESLCRGKKTIKTKTIILRNKISVLDYCYIPKS